MTEQHRDVRDYLKRLDRALSHVPRERRREIVGEIEAHIDQELAALGRKPGDHEVVDVLQSVGDPETIAAGAADVEEPRRQGLGGVEISALLLLLVGGFFPFALGWIIGVVLLWISSSWTVGQKVLGTLVVPGGLITPLFLVNIFMGSGGQSCTVGELYKRMPNGRDKLIDNGPQMCTRIGPPEWVRPTLMVVLVIASIATVIYLGRSARKRPSAA